MWPLLCHSLGISISLCGVTVCSKHIGRRGGEQGCLVNEIILPMFSGFRIHSAASFRTTLRTCLSFRRTEFYFSQSAAPTEKPAVSLFISLWLASRHQNTEKRISGKKAKVPTEKQPFVDPTGYLEAGRWGGWAGGHAGCLWAGCGWLGTACLAPISATSGPSANLAEFTSARSRAAICSLPSPPARSNQTSSHLGLELPACALFTHAGACALSLWWWH